MAKYISRVLEKELKKYLKLFPVVGLTGPRQSGKSTLLKKSLTEYKYISFDDHKIINLFYDDPEKFMQIYNDKVVFDEVQKAPEIFDYIKIAVDNDRDNYGKFILTGSSQFKLNKNISESLAGRIGLLSLLPFHYGEINVKNREELIYKGSFPELFTRNYLGCEEWYSAYMDTYIEKDLKTISNIGDLKDFRRFISLLAANTSQILNMSKYASNLGVAVSTINRWISVLEASYIIFLLPPFYKNYGKRLIKSPKVFFWDTGLVSYLTGITTQKLFENGPMAGSLFENYVIAEIMKKELHNKTKAEFYYLRTNNGLEIDLILDKKGKQEFFEIKFSKTFKSRMVKHIETIKDTTEKGYLIYNGKDFPYTNNIKILNLYNYL